MLRSIQELIQIPSTSCKVALVILNLFLSVPPVEAQTSDNLLEEEVTRVQRSIIQKLTGVTEISEGLYLKSRSTVKQRKAASNFLFSALEAEGLNVKKHHYKTSNKLSFLDLFFDPYMGTNIYAVIPATIPSEEYVLLGAHYDAEPGSPGANDNATGVALVYQIALQLHREEYRGRNFIVVFFDQEEDGLIGSKAFAHKMSKEAKLLHSVHTADMLGWDADKDGAIELEYPTEALYELYSKSAAGLGIPLHQTNVAASDHDAFRQMGYRAVGLAEEYANGDTTPHYHKATDTEDTVDYHFLFNATRLVWSAMQELAANPQIN